MICQVGVDNNVVSLLIKGRTPCDTAELAIALYGYDYLLMLLHKYTSLSHLTTPNEKLSASRFHSRVPVSFPQELMDNPRMR